MDSDFLLVNNGELFEESVLNLRIPSTESKLLIEIKRN